jgi:hypothetical protein
VIGPNWISHSMSIGFYCTALNQDSLEPG